MHYKGSQISEYLLTATTFLMVVAIVDNYWIFTLPALALSLHVQHTFNVQSNLMRKIPSLTPFNKAINLREICDLFKVTWVGSFGGA